MLRGAAMTDPDRLPCPLLRITDLSQTSRHVRKVPNPEVAGRWDSAGGTEI